MGFFNVTFVLLYALFVTSIEVVSIGGVGMDYVDTQ